MLRHGWLCEKRAQWAIDEALQRAEVRVCLHVHRCIHTPSTSMRINCVQHGNTFIMYVSRWQQWKSRETGDYYARTFAYMLGKWSYRFDGYDLLHAIYVRYLKAV